MKDAYSGAEAILGLIKNQRKSAQESAVNAERLPYELTKAYRENADPKLQKSINEAEAKALSAPTEGLAKYQNIENPFTRRALADKYATSVGAEYKNLLGEQERRQGVITDYINMWSGTYGAIAKGEQMKAEALQSEFSSTMQLAGNRAGSSSSSSTSAEFKGYLTDQLARNTGNDGKYDPAVYRQLRDESYKYGITKEQFDAQFSSGLGAHEYENLGVSTSKEQTEKQKLEETYYKAKSEMDKNPSWYEDNNGNIYDDGGFFGSKKLIARKP